MSGRDAAVVDEEDVEDMELLLRPLSIDDDGDDDDDNVEGEEEDMTDDVEADVAAAAALASSCAAKLSFLSEVCLIWSRIGSK